jgi:hypothetical protein
MNITEWLHVTDALKMLATKNDPDVKRACETLRLACDTPSSHAHGAVVRYAPAFDTAAKAPTMMPSLEGRYVRITDVYKGTPK